MAIKINSYVGIVAGAKLALASVAVIAGAAHYAATPSAIAIAGSLPACPYEDGNTDGLPCDWVDADTGSHYYVQSDDYR